VKSSFIPTSAQKKSSESKQIDRGRGTTKSLEDFNVGIQELNDISSIQLKGEGEEEDKGGEEAHGEGEEEKKKEKKTKMKEKKKR